MTDQMDHVRLEPDDGAVLQAEEDQHDYALGTVPVCVEDWKGGPIRVQPLPRKAGSTRTRSVDDTAAVQLLTADPRRGAVTLMAMDQNIRFALNEASASDPSTMSVWPKLVPLPITATTGVWVQCAAASTSTQVSITAEFWAEPGA